MTTTRPTSAVSAASTSTLYATDPATRFFFIPDDAHILPGKLVLRSLAGKERQVDGVVAAVWEVTEEEAKEIAARHIRAFSANIGRALRGAKSVLEEVGKTQQRVADGVAEAAAGPAQADLIAEALGISPEQLREDPSAVKDGLQRAFSALLADMKAMVNAEQPGQEVLQGRLERLATVLREQGWGDAGDTLERLPEVLRAGLSDPELEAEVRAASARLREVADDLRGRRAAAPQEH
jgi:hypothetical protein